MQFRRLVQLTQRHYMVYATFSALLIYKVLRLENIYISHLQFLLLAEVAGFIALCIFGVECPEVITFSLLSLVKT